MKKLSLLLVLVLLFSVISCSSEPNADAFDSTSQNSSANSNTSDENSNTSDENSNNSEMTNKTDPTCVHVWQSATCIKAKTCSKCNETIGEALGHTTDAGFCSRCNENCTAWDLGEYNDEFKQPTGKKYMVARAIGIFSNSATTDSDLIACVQIDQDNVAILLWEYARNLVKGIYDYEYYQVTILDENETKHTFTGTIYKGDTRIYFKDNDRERVFDLLKNNDSLYIYLVASKYSVSTYLFEIDTKGFSAIYNSIT